MADGGLHSSGDLARCLGVGRGTVRGLLRRARADFGLEVRAVRGHGYRLLHPLELLEVERIQAELDEGTRRLLGGLEVLPVVDSTNRYLRQRIRGGLVCGHACLAECQLSGRGRQGRSWISPFAAGIYLSVYWRFTTLAHGLAGLSLALGAVAAEAITELGVADVALKWPNDLYWMRRKLGGVLVEAQGTTAPVTDVIVGLGVNGWVPPASGAGIDQPWADLRTAAGRDPGRNRAAARLLQHVLRGLDRFAHTGFGSFRESWARRDLARGAEVELRAGHETVRGIARGVDETGALVLESQRGRRRLVSGELSLRILR